MRTEIPEPTQPGSLPALKDPVVSGRIGRSVAALGGGEIVARVFAFAGTTYLARVLGPEGFGILGFALALAGYLSLSVTAGVNAAGAHAVSKRPNAAGDYAASVVAARIVIASLAFGVLLLVAWFLPKPNTVRVVLALTGLSFFALAIDTSWVHKGLEQNGRVAVAAVLTQIVFVLLILSSVRTPADVVRVPVALFVGQVAAALFLAAALFNRRGLRPRLRVGFELFRSSRYLLASKALRTLLFTADVLILGLFYNERLVGLYTAPYRICYLFIALSGTILFAFLPEFTRAAAHGTKQLCASAERSLDTSWALCAPVAAGGIVLASPILSFIFGSAYEAATLAFQLLLVSTAFIFVHATLQNIFLVTGRTRSETWIMAAAVLLNIILNLSLIPSFGIAGAAFATAAAEFAFITAGWYVVREAGIALSMRPLLKSTVAAIAMAGILVLIPSVHVLLRVGLGAVIYGILLGLLGGYPAGTLKDLERLLRVPGSRPASG